MNTTEFQETNFTLALGFRKLKNVLVSYTEGEFKVVKVSE